MENNRQAVHSRAHALAEGFSRDDRDGHEESDAFPGLPFVVEAGPRLVALLEQNTVGAERFRVLAGRLQSLQKKQRLKKIAITSAIQGDGKSLIAANLALTLARSQKTLLIDGDLRESGLKPLLGTHSVSGLTEWWLGDRDVRGFLLRLDAVSFWHLAAGQVAEQPLEILQSRKISDMLTEISDGFDWIIIDSPPLVPVADGHIWAGHADGSLLVVRQGKTPRKLLQSGLENGEHVKWLGAVMNGRQDLRRQYYYAQSSYGQVRPNTGKQSRNKPMDRIV
jgi:capsular exopolysaccharide synthesis family protein